MSSFLQLAFALVVILFAAKLAGYLATRTLFTVVETEELVDKVIAATQAITGDVNQPETGILAVMPVVKGYGLNRID